MNSYPQLLKLQAQTAWDVWYECSAVACHITATAWNTYRSTFFSDRAAENYRLIGEIIGHCIIIAIILLRRLNARIDAHIEACQKESEAGGHPPHQSVPTHENLSQILDQPSRSVRKLTESTPHTAEGRAPSSARQLKRSRPSQVAQGFQKPRNNRGELVLLSGQ